MSPPPLPFSLAPHVLVHTSSDLDQLLASRNLPPLHVLLQSFSPLQQVTTRTLSLAPVTHNNFTIRFSSLSDIEDACKEDEEQRASRTIDWIGSRIASQAPSWVADPQSQDQERWWTHLKSCVEGDRTPARSEGWNHPVALILAASTMAPNPLQAITALHSTDPDLPPWVDSNMYRYTLIVHPSPSNLNPDEAVALLNAVKRQFGLNTHLLQLPSLSESTTIHIQPRLPQLPPPTADSYSQAATAPSHFATLSMSEMDAQNTGRFVREFATMSLIPWMERCITEWNEAFSSTRRLPTRLFSSTARRLFGSSPQPTTAHSTPGNTTPTSSVSGGIPTFTSPHRRLAEFATILGDYKLATMVWDAIRKEVQSGMDVLPLIVAPTPALSAHTSAALAALGLSESNVPASAQLRAMIYAVRWEVGVQDFIRLDGERWLAWAAGHAEEPTSALLLARAASISSRKGAKRRAALWYAMAAKRLEKTGIKALTIQFFENAKEARSFTKEQNFSPSFYDIEGDIESSGFDRIKPYLDHSVGRLKYSSGDTAGAVRLFYGLLRAHDAFGNVLESDRMYLEDFRVAFQHLLATDPNSDPLTGLDLPVRFTRAAQTRIRLGSDIPTSDANWAEMEDTWRSFWKSEGGKAQLDTRQTAQTGVPFWVDLSLFNPLDVEVSLSQLTIKIEASGADSSISASEIAEIDSVETVVLRPKEPLMVSIRVVPHVLSTMKISHASYSFLSLIQVSESLSSRGKRLNETAAQRSSNTYGPDIFAQVQVRPKTGKLDIQFEDGSHEPSQEVFVYDGEIRNDVIRITNVGDSVIGEVWLVLPDDGSIWLDDKDEESAQSDGVHSVQYSTSLRSPKPRLLKGVQLKPGEHYDCSVLLYHVGSGARSASVLGVFRESEAAAQFYTSRATRAIWVAPLLSVAASIQPSVSTDASYLAAVKIENSGSAKDLRITQVGAISPAWQLSSLDKLLSAERVLLPRQHHRSFLKMSIAPGFDHASASKPMQNLSTALTAVLEAKDFRNADFSTDVTLYLSNAVKDGPSLLRPALHFAHALRRSRLLRALALRFPSIPSQDCATIFPLYTMQDMSLVVSWTIPKGKRSGHFLLSNLLIGPKHGALNELLARARGAAQGRSMYAETARERTLLLEAIRASPWNLDENPVHAYMKAIPKVLHDFGKGPCQIVLDLVLRNYSFNLAGQFTIRLHNAALSPSTRFIGALKHRGNIPPRASTTVQVKVFVVSSGVYNIPGCFLSVQTEKEGIVLGTFPEENIAGVLLDVSESSSRSN